MAWNLRGLPLTRLGAKTSPPLALIAAALDGVPSMPVAVPSAPAPLGAFGPEHLPLHLCAMALELGADTDSELGAKTLECPSAAATPPRAGLRARWRRGVLVPMSGPPVGETAIVCVPSLAVVPSAPPPPPPPPASDSDMDFPDEPSSEGESLWGPAPPPGVIIVNHTTILNVNTTHFHGRVDNVNLGCGNVVMFRGPR